MHGHAGPVNVSYSRHVYNQTGNLFAALNELGIPTAEDPNAGTVAGASYMPVDIDPVRQTRSDARVAYYDPYISRTNLWVSTGQAVTQVLMQGVTNNAKSAIAVAGDDSVGQGNSTSTGYLFGNETVATSNMTVRSLPDTTRFVTDKLACILKKWLGVRNRQATRTAPMKPMQIAVRAVGVEVCLMISKSGTLLTNSSLRPALRVFGKMSPSLARLFFQQVLYTAHRYSSSLVSDPWRNLHLLTSQWR